MSPTIRPGGDQPRRPADGVPPRPPGDGVPPPLRSPRQELADSTAHGEVYLRRLRRAQLQLSLLGLTAFGAVFGILPLALYLMPRLDRIHILGVPLPIWIMLVPLAPLFIAIGWLYARRADALDVAFRDLVQK